MFAGNDRPSRAFFFAPREAPLQTLNANDQAKIQAGANAYLELSSDVPDKTEEFLSSLRHKLGWTPAEIIQLQTRVVDMLLERRKM